MIKSPLKIAMVAACPFPCPRGTPIRILRMAEALAKRGHEVHVATYHLALGEAPASLHVHRTPRIATYTRLAPGPSYQKLLVVDPLLTAKLRAVIRRHDIDVIHAHHYEGLLIAAIARGSARLPLIYDAHTMLVPEISAYALGLPEWIVRRFGQGLDRVLPRLADCSIAASEEIRQSLIADAGAPPERVFFVPNGVELDRFAGLSVPFSSAAPFNRLVFTGNLARYQGIDLLLRAFAEVVRRRQDVRLTIATDTPFQPYRSLAERLGLRRFLDIDPAPAFAGLPVLLGSSDIAVNPRVACAGLPVKLLNYMAAARPIVSFANSAGGVQHRRSGWLVPDDDVGGFADGILTLLADRPLATDLGRNARRYAEAHHNWDRAVEAVETIYEAALATNRRPQRSGTSGCSIQQ